MTGDPLSDEDIERGRHLFAQSCDFAFAAGSQASMPPASLPEVAFAGRSNVGKSSLLNALTGRNALARVSRTPGRTKEINFFDLGGKLFLVDLPGYGYAKVSHRQSETWNKLIRSYLRGRPTLKRVCVLVDARHGLKESDKAVMDLLDGAAMSYQIVLTKADEASREELARVVVATAREAAKHGAAHPVLLETSSLTGMGIPALRAMLAQLADP